MTYSLEPSYRRYVHRHTDMDLCLLLKILEINMAEKDLIKVSMLVNL